MSQLFDPRQGEVAQIPSMREVQTELLLQCIVLNILCVPYDFC